MNGSFVFHIPTLFVIMAGITFITTFLLVIASLSSDKNRELKLWSQGNVSICLGFLIGGAPNVPDFVHAMMSYGLMGLGLGYVYAGLRVFIGKKYSWTSVLSIAVIAGLSSGYYVYLKPSLSGRLLISSLYFGMLNLLCAFTLLRPSFAIEKGALWLAGSGFAVMSIALFCRAAFILYQEQMSSFVSNQVEAVTLLLTAMVQIWIAFSLIFMITSRYAKEILHLSMTDTLTGILNRSGLNSLGMRMLLRAEQKKTPMAVLVFDADHFKKINDRYGHLFGDEILRLLAQFSQNALRPNDLLARFGGEEFIAILDSVSQEDSILIAERLCRTIEKSDFKVEDTQIPCTVSIGISCTGLSDTYSLQALISSADQALYRAKQEGRNRVCLSESKIPSQ